jgi:hypothetical protein
MFKQNANATCNNILFKPARISGMTEKVRHPSMVRLYAIASNHKDKVIGQSAVARALNISPQRVKNWEERGISEKGARLASDRFGCNPSELIEAAETSPPTQHRAEDTKVAYMAAKDDPLKTELLSLWSHLDEAHKNQWLGDLRRFVKDQRPHKNGAASALAGK